MTPRTRLALVAAAVVLLVVAFVVASGSGNDKKSGAAATTAAQAPAPATSTGADTAPATTAPATTAPAPAVPVIRIVGGKAQGGVKRLTFTKGDTIRFAVVSDTAGEIHVHGFDVHKDVKAGGRVQFSIPATIEGRFVVELEATGTQIAELEVDPK
jgi:hypothetical protein